MNMRWFWAYQKLSKGLKSDDCPHIEDEDGIVEIIINGLYSKAIPKGDGKFDRLMNYIKNNKEIVSDLKKLITKRDVHLAFVMGVEATLNFMEQKAEEIKKSH